MKNISLNVGQIMMKTNDRKKELKEAYQEMSKQSKKIGEEMLTASKESLDEQ